MGLNLLRSIAPTTFGAMAAVLSIHSAGKSKYAQRRTMSDANAALGAGGSACSISAVTPSGLLLPFLTFWRAVEAVRVEGRVRHVYPEGQPTFHEALSYRFSCFGFFLLQAIEVLEVVGEKRLREDPRVPHDLAPV